MSQNVPDAPRGESRAFDLLHEKVRRWIWKEGWDTLRDAQEEAISAVLGCDSDVLISAPTAAGKTEAAFLPICSALIDDITRGFRALYVSPLKALINDQYSRLSYLFETGEIPVHRWHGDVPASRKQAAMSDPKGILLITPESLEAMFVSRGPMLKAAFGQLRWVVLDEMHAYIGTPRGQQLQSLLCRMDQVVGSRVRRIALSATLGDMSIAAAHLNAKNPESVRIIVSESEGQELQLQIRGYIDRKPPSSGRSLNGEEEPTRALEQVARHVFRTLRGSSNLVFANSRARVEALADRLRRLSEGERTPNEFFPHHGNLSKELREDLEQRLQEQNRPTTAVCTSTLELGIDIGQVKSIGQVGAPFAVSSMRQRLGRSGRRGDPAILRVYISEPELTPDSPLPDALRFNLVQSVAMVTLLAKRWCEPPSGERLHLSTLVHQVLSMIAQQGGVTASQAWNQLCDKGAFSNVSKGMFTQLLMDMGDAELITQSPDLSLLLNAKGERIVNHFSFYTVFETPEEFRIVHNGRTLGSISIDHGLVEGGVVIFGGRRWRVVVIDNDQKRIDVLPGPGGHPPQFEPRLGGSVHDEIRRRMEIVYQTDEIPAYLDPKAASLLKEARGSFRSLRIAEQPIQESGAHTWIFVFRGDRTINTLAALLATRNVPAAITGPVLSVYRRSTDEIKTLLASMTTSRVDPVVLARDLRNKRTEKYDWALGEDLLSAQYASYALDVEGAMETIDALLGRGLAQESSSVRSVRKNQFLEYLICPRSAWLSARQEPEELSIADSQRLDEGRAVHELARSRYSGGVVPAGESFAELVARTRQLMRGPECRVIFEAAFETGGLTTRADILQRAGNGWHLTEVKSGTATSVGDQETVEGEASSLERSEYRAKRDYVDDLTYTALVATRAGVQLAGCSLMLLNPLFEYGDPEDERFIVVDKTIEVSGRLEDPRWARAGAVQTISNPIPPKGEWIVACKSCGHFTSRCLGRGVPNPITEIPDLRKRQLREILATGAVSIERIPATLDLGDRPGRYSPPKNRVRHCVQQGKPFVSSELRSTLESLNWPLKFLDFETMSTALPQFARMRPWEPVVTQYSVHTLSTFAEAAEHSAFLVPDPQVDSRRELMMSLLRDLGNTGDIIVYSGYEQRTLKVLAGLFLDLTDDIESVEARIVDLLSIIRDNYYHPDFRGSLSIKRVLRILAQGFSYDDLEIRDGGTASALAARRCQSLISLQEWGDLRGPLLRYCERDTEAMMRVLEALWKISGRR
jgi:ATP-dependent Lhr-like helicase